MKLKLDSLCHHNRERTLAQKPALSSAKETGGWEGGPNKQWVGKNSSHLTSKGVILDEGGIGN